MKSFLATASVVALLCSVTASAKGNFQAEGVFSEVHKDGQALVFTFTGSISLAYATAPPDHEKRQWNTISFHDISVVIRITPGVSTASQPFEGHVFDLERGYKNVSSLAANGSKSLMAIDRPILSFSNRGDLEEIAGTYVYARENPY